MRLVAVCVLSCVVSVLALDDLEEQNLVSEDILQDLTSRSKKSPEDLPSESDMKQVLTQDIKTKIGDLKELKSAYKQVVNDFFGSENSSDKITPEKSTFEGKLDGEKSEDVDSVRNPRQYYLDLGYNRENERQNSYSNENYDRTYSSQNTNDRSDDPYIASSYNPDPRTFNFGFQAGFQADKKSDTAKTHSHHVEYVPYYYPVVPEYQQIIQPVYPVVKPPEITVKPVVIKPIYKPVTVKPVEIKPIEIKPYKPIEIKPIEIKPIEIKPVRPIEIKPPKPIEIKPIEIKPPKPIEIRPISIKPVHHHKPVVIQTPVVQPQIQYQPVHQEVQSPVYYTKIEKGWPGKFFSKQIMFGPSADFGSEHNYYPSSYSYPSTYSYPSAEAYYPQGFTYNAPSYPWYPQEDVQSNNYGQSVYPQGYYSQQTPGYSYYPQSNVNYPQNNLYYPQNNLNYPQNSFNYPPNNLNYPYGNFYRSSESAEGIQSYRDELDHFLTQLLELSASVQNKTLTQDQAYSADQLKAEIEKEKKTIQLLEENASTDYEEMLGSDGQGFNVENIVDWLSGEMEDIHSRWESLKNEFRKPDEKTTTEEVTQEEGKPDEEMKQ